MLYCIERGTDGESARETPGVAQATERDPVDTEIRVEMLPVAVMAVVLTVATMP